MLVLIVFLFKGQFANILNGSIVYKLFILELAGVATFVYSMVLFKRRESSLFNIGLITLITVLIYIAVLQPLPDFEMLI